MKPKFEAAVNHSSLTTLSQAMLFSDICHDKTVVNVLLHIYLCSKQTAKTILFTLRLFTTTRYNTQLHACSTLRSHFDGLRF